MDGWPCNKGSRGVVVNRTKTYFLFTFVIHVSKCLHPCPKNAVYLMFFLTVHHFMFFFSSSIIFFHFSVFFLQVCQLNEFVFNIRTKSKCGD